MYFISQNFRDARLDKLDSSKNSWTIFAIENILLVNKVKMKVINNYNTNTSICLTQSIVIDGDRSTNLKRTYTLVCCSCFVLNLNSNLVNNLKISVVRN